MSVLEVKKKNRVHRACVSALDSFLPSLLDINACLVSQHTLGLRKCMCVSPLEELRFSQSYDYTNTFCMPFLTKEHSPSDPLGEQEREALTLCWCKHH